MSKVENSKNLAIKIMMLSSENKRLVLDVLDTLKKSEEQKR